MYKKDRNDLDPETSVQLYQVYVVPTLVYGLELILPEQRLVDSLERTNKKFLKHILSLPNTTADSAVYILTGTIPVEGVIHKRALSLFGNVCRQEKNSTEQRLAQCISERMQNRRLRNGQTFTGARAFSRQKCFSVLLK